MAKAMRVYLYWPDGSEVREPMFIGGRNEHRYMKAASETPAVKGMRFEQYMPYLGFHVIFEVTEVDKDMALAVMDLSR